MLLLELGLALALMGATCAYLPLPRATSIGEVNTGGFDGGDTEGGGRAPRVNPIGKVNGSGAEGGGDQLALGGVTCAHLFFPRAAVMNLVDCSNTEGGGRALPLVGATCAYLPFPRAAIINQVDGGGVAASVSTASFSAAPFATALAAAAVSAAAVAAASVSASSVIDSSNIEGDGRAPPLMRESYTYRSPSHATIIGKVNGGAEGRVHAPPLVGATCEHLPLPRTGRNRQAIDIDFEPPPAIPLNWFAWRHQRGHDIEINSGRRGHEIESNSEPPPSMPLECFAWRRLVGDATHALRSRSMIVLALLAGVEAGVSAGIYIYIYKIGRAHV